MLTFDHKLVVDRNDLRWRILAHCVEMNLDARELEVEQWADALDAFDHASGNRREEQLRGIERVTPSGNIGVEHNLGVLAEC